MSSLPAAIVRDLRLQFRGTKIAELIEELAGFEECFASASHFASVLAVCDRTVFRYFRVLKDAGLVERVPGSRYADEMPSKASFPGKLRSHGYAITRFRGWLANVVAQGRSMFRQSREKRAKEAEARAKRELVAESNRKRNAALEFVQSLQGPPPIAPVPAERRKVPAPVKAPDPHCWGEREAAAQLALSAWVLGDTGPPD